MTEKTYMQAVYEGAERMSMSTAGKHELSGLSREQFLTAVKAITVGLAELSPQTSMNLVLLAVTFVRNALILTMRDNQATMDAQTEMNG